MLNNFIINGIDTFNIIYLWTALTKKNNNIFKLWSSILIISILTTIIEELLGLSFIVTYIMTIITIKIIYKKDLKNIIFGLLVILLIDMLLQLTLDLVISKFIYDYIYEGFIVELIILICVIIFSKINSLYKNISLENIDSNVLIYFISTCSVYAIGLKIIFNYYNNIIKNNLAITSVILSILISSQILVYLYIVKIIKEKEKLKISNEYNIVIDEIIQEIKQRQHDFVNYKNTIRGIVEVVDDKDVKATINNYMKNEDIYDDKINDLIYIDNPVIRSIIYRNMCKAKKYNVNFKYNIENEVLDHILDYNEISNILNNLLNNAFEEVIKDECTKKDIQIKILKQNKISHLIIKNQIVSANDFNVNEMFMRGYSTKNAGTRGYGLYNVQQIVNSHKGYIKMKVECEEITFDIYFNNSLE